MSAERNASENAPYRVPTNRGHRPESPVEQPHRSLPESANIPSFPHWLRSQHLQSVGSQLQHHPAHIHGTNVHVSQPYLPHTPFTTSSYPTFRTFPQPLALPATYQSHRDDSHEVLLPPILNSSGASSEPRLKKPTTSRACRACKQAHVRCDEEKPCNRCKTQHLDCVPAEQKKRGRPPRSSAHDILQRRRVNANPATGADNVERASATIPPHSSSSYPDVKPEPGIGQTPHVPFQTFSPVAFLDITLIVMRVNESFQATFGANMRLVGRPIGDLIEPGYRHLTESLRHALIGEKTAREAPEISSSLQDHFLAPGPPEVDSVEPSDLANAMAPFADRRFKMAFRLATGPLTMTVSFRLARMNSCFVVLTLPDRRGHLPVYLFQPQNPEFAAAISRPSHLPLLAPQRHLSSSPHFSASAPPSPHHSYGDALRTRSSDALFQPRPQNMLQPLSRVNSFTPVNEQPLLRNPYASQYQDQYLSIGQPAQRGSPSPLNPAYERLTPGQEPRRPRSAEMAQVLSRMAETGRQTMNRPAPELQGAEQRRSEYGTKRRRDSPPERHLPLRPTTRDGSQEQTH